MAKKPKVTDPVLGKVAKKAEAAGTKVKHVNAIKKTANDIGKNPNGSWTSNGSLNQGYDKETKQFTKTTTQTKSGRMAVEGSTRAGGLRHSATLAEEDRTGNAKLGRGGKLVTRRQRYGDLRQAFNNVSPEVMAMNGWTAGGAALSAG